ncbi:MAG: hypothetical protein EZS28_048396, partial [Streblomastix strix]
KKKEQGTNVISELQGGNSGQDVALHRLIIILILISHTIAIMSAIVGTIQYTNESESYKVGLENLLQVCTLTATALTLPSFAIQTLYHDISHKFKYQGIQDGQEETIPSWEQIKKNFEENGEQITRFVSNIYEKTTNTAPWEDSNLRIYIFDVSLQGDGTVNANPVMLAQELQLSSLIRAMTNLAQKSNQFGRLISKQPEIEMIIVGIYINFN